MGYQEIPKSGGKQPALTSRARNLPERVPGATYILRREPALMAIRMLLTQTQESLDFYALSALQIGWEFNVTQLARATQASSTTLIQSRWVSLVPMRLNASFDQMLVGRPGYVNFGVPAANSTPIWVGGEPVPTGKLVLFPTAEQGSSASRPGFSATAIHLRQSQLEKLLQVLFHRTLGDLLAHTGATQMRARDQFVLNTELRKWSYLAGHTHLATEKRLRCREEDLACNRY